ncbi:type II secretion system F family protein, partial [Escherichia coli]|uniref:type II secretion system F family protein n=1 Tax=Escherichia coli TaxID=562 RepID=UPI0019333E95
HFEADGPIDGSRPISVVALSKALDLVQKTRQIHSVKRFSDHLRIQVMQGTSFSQALQTCPGIRTAWIQLLAAGEQTGTLPAQMER